MEIPREERLRRLEDAFNRPPLLPEDVIRECWLEFGVDAQGLEEESANESR